MKGYVWLLVLTLQTNVLTAQTRFDIIIYEIMADPAPALGLPNNEWIELRNISSVPVDIQNWRIGDADSQSGPINSFILQPDSFVIVCAASAVPFLSVFGNTVTVTGFPSLDNDGDQLFLKAANGSIIHSVRYSSSWYQNELKKNGGWTLEMIDPRNPCGNTDNWKASTHSIGGTPGKINSVNGTSTDMAGPQLKRSYATSDTTVILVFDESLDSSSGAVITNYAIDRGTITDAVTLSPFFDQVQLTIQPALQPATVYTVTANAIADCKGNTTHSGNEIKTGIAADAGPAEIIINEILFDPPPNGHDYIELYNKSNQIIDASKLYIANRNSSNSISSITQVAPIPFCIFPGEYLLLTEDAGSLALNYLVQNPGALLTLSSLPSFPDDKGTVVLLNSQGEVTDEVNYNKAWHFKLIVDTRGIALERVDPAGISQDAANWHSAASTSGYGTPTYKNSQFKQVPTITAAIDIQPPVFSPDNDGYQDIASIHYKIDEPGYVATIIIFDGAGRPVKSLVRNATLGNSGYWNWDGLNDKGQKLPVGSYIVFTEIFNLQGRKERFKNTVVLARRLN